MAQTGQEWRYSLEWMALLGTEKANNLARSCRHHSFIATTQFIDRWKIRHEVVLCEFIVVINILKRFVLSRGTSQSQEDALIYCISLMLESTGDENLTSQQYTISFHKKGFIVIHVHHNLMWPHRHIVLYCTYNLVYMSVMIWHVISEPLL